VDSIESQLLFANLLQVLFKLALKLSFLLISYPLNLVSLDKLTAEHQSVCIFGQRILNFNLLKLFRNLLHFIWLTINLCLILKI